MAFSFNRTGSILCHYFMACRCVFLPKAELQEILFAGPDAAMQRGFQSSPELK
jgi:hypothetical protein